MRLVPTTAEAVPAPVGELDARIYTPHEVRRFRRWLPALRQAIHHGRPEEKVVPGECWKEEVTHDR